MKILEWDFTSANRVGEVNRPNTFVLHQYRIPNSIFTQQQTYKTMCFEVDYIYQPSAEDFSSNFFQAMLATLSVSRRLKPVLH